MTVEEFFRRREAAHVYRAWMSGADDEIRAAREEERFLKSIGAL